MKNLTEVCLNQASYSRYKGDIEEISFKAGSRTGVMFDIRFKSFEQHLHEEKLVINAINLFGNLGGSFGLVIGFSCFGYISIFLDLIWDNFIVKNILNIFVLKKSNFLHKQQQGLYYS